MQCTAKRRVEVRTVEIPSTDKGAYKYYVIRDGVGGGKGKDNPLITCPGREGGGGR